MTDTEDVKGVVLTVLKWIAIGILIGIGFFIADRWIF